MHATPMRNTHFRSPWKLAVFSILIAGCFALAVTLSGQTVSVGPAFYSLQQAAPAQGGSTAAAPARVWIGPDGKPLPFKNDDEILEFLRTAKVVKLKDIPTGVTGPRKALLEKDGIQADAVFRDVHEDKQMVKLGGGGTEMFFRDDYIFEPAAYEMSRLLGMDNVPPAVLATVRGTKGSLQIWVEGAMTSGDRIKNKVVPPDQTSYNLQLFNMHFFDALIYNTDRNPGNILIDKDWKVWLIDHTRAFRRQETLNNPQGILQCDRKLYAALQALDPAEVHKRLEPFLRKAEIDAILKRRDKIVEIIRNRIAELGEDKVLYDTD